MSHKANTTLIGAFVLGAVGILIAAILFFTGGDFFRKKSLIVMHFDRSIQGLELGAALKLRGVKMGEVTRIESHFYRNTMSVINSVYVQVLEDQTYYEGDEAPDDLMKKLVNDHGLRAQLKTQSYLTGLLYIEVDFLGNNSDIKLWGLDPDVFELPTTPTEIEKLSDIANEIDFKQIADYFDNMAANINKFLANPEIQAIPGNINTTLLSVNRLADNADRVLLTELRGTVANFNSLLNQLGADYPELAADLKDSLDSLRRSFISLEGAIGDTGHLLSDDSPLVFEINETLSEISRAARKVSSLAESLERQPEAILRGKSNR